MWDSNWIEPNLKTGSRKELANSPLLGKDNRFFAFFTNGVDLSFGLLCDLKPVSTFGLTSSNGLSGASLCLSFWTCALDISTVPADLVEDDEPHPSECEAAVFWLETFDWSVTKFVFLPVVFKWDLVLLLPSDDPFSRIITPSLRLISRKRFSHGRTAIHLSNQFQPQLLLSGSNWERAACCLDPACHWRWETINQKHRTLSLKYQVSIKLGEIKTYILWSSI